uniref:PcfJ domain-containing protein n=1 Tax=uncultured Dysgonomonas sp. TaxID=206096 RepID=UPI0025873B79|nr:PcfJ domain-containing protein [uncultured Dysgonomonas sp.]
MKPKTKLQHEVIANSQQLYKIDNDMLSWAKKDILEHKGFATKTRVICMDCGNSFSPELVSRKRAVCPHCNTKLKIEQTKKRTDKQHIFVGCADIVDRFQVMRYFEIIGYYKAGEPSRYYISEIIQQWILPNGKHEYYGQNHTLTSYVDSWNGPMEIRKHYTNYYTPHDKYEVYPKAYHPDSVFKSEYRKYGIDHNLDGLTFLRAIKLLPESPMAETLLKAKQYSLLGYLDNYYSSTYRYWSSIKICLRNKYFIKDAKYYIDYLELLDHFDKDLRNAHYVCPKNLKKEHDLLVAKRKRQREKENAIQKREKLLKDQKVFEKLKKAMLTGIVFSDGTIKVRVLESVKEYIEEGDSLHHCVASYALKEDSLIFSARIRGKRIETVEVSLKQLKVVQSRGLQNKNTEYHDRIISLMNKNMHLIKERLKPKKNGTKKDVNRIPQAVDMAV